MANAILDMTAASGRRRGRPRSALATTAPPTDPPSDIVVDPLRAVVFPNRIREQRVGAGHIKLLAFALSLPDIPYIRLSKIERGEVFPRAAELVRIAALFDVAPTSLLVDVESPDFDLETWFAPFAETAALDDEAEARLAVLVAAALRALRDGNPALTASALDTEHGIAPVILSRIENAQKGLARWNAPTVQALCRLFGVADEAALRDHVAALHRDGALDRFLPTIARPERREARTRQRIAALRQELRHAEPLPRPAPPPASAVRKATAGAASAARLVPVLGAPLPDGLIALTPTGTQVEAPSIAGPRAYGVRVGRPTLGSGLPGHATVIVDPDRYPQAGGIALIREGDAYRLVSIALDRHGVMVGHCQNPDREIALDMLSPADVAAVVAALFL